MRVVLLVGTIVASVAREAFVPVYSCCHVPLMRELGSKLLTASIRADYSTAT